MGHFEHFFVHGTLIWMLSVSRDLGHFLVTGHQHNRTTISIYYLVTGHIDFIDSNGPNVNRNRKWIIDTISSTDKTLIVSQFMVVLSAFPLQKTFKKPWLRDKILLLQKILQFYDFLKIHNPITPPNPPSKATRKYPHEIKMSKTCKTNWRRRKKSNVDIWPISYICDMYW